MDQETPRTILLELQQVKEDARTSMGDMRGVQRVASDLDCYELALWIEDLFDELSSIERSKQFMAALRAMGPLPRGAWRNND